MVPTSIIKTGIFGLIIFIGLGYLPLIYRNITRAPPISSPPKYHVIDNSLSSDLQNILIKRLREASPYDNIKESVKMTKYEHIGEAVAILNDSTCPHPYLTPDISGKKCVLMQRIDVVMHHALSGGYEGNKDYSETIAQRTMFFENYNYKDRINNSIRRNEFNELTYNNIKFMNATNDICGDDKPILDLNEMFYNIRIPGQVSPYHLDAPFFNGATRFIFPHWLLVAMERSKIYRQYRIPQVQVIIYLNKIWDNNDGGEFLWHDKGSNYNPIIIKPIGRRVIVNDGSLTVHGSKVFKPYKEHLMPKFNRNIIYKLEYINNNKWRIYDHHNSNHTFITLNESDLRLAIVIRGKCYSSLNELNEYNAYEETNNFTINNILNDFINDLKKKGRYNNEGQKKYLSDTENAMELAQKIMNEYIIMPYPVTKSWIPFNFCVIPELNKYLLFLKPLLSFVCN